MTGSMWRDGWLMGIGAGRLFSYANFMVYAACLAVLRVEWSMSATQAGTISAGFMVGYAASLLIFSWLAERFGARRIFLLSTVISAASALAFGVFARDYPSALVLYSLAALTQGGMYTPGIMLMAERYGPERRGAAVGFLIASTSAAYAFSLGVSGLMLALGGYRLAFLVSGLLPFLGAAILWAAVRRVPNVIHARPENLGVGAALAQNAPARRLILGYVCHNWELLGMWAWAPAFLAASLALGGAGAVAAAEIGSYLTAVMHGIGAVASSSMGHLSDRLGRRAVLVTLAGVSAAFSFALGWLVALPVALLALLMLVYGFVAIGDSPVLSAALTEAVPPAYLGSALAVRSLLGFGAGAAAPVAFGFVLDLTNAPGATPALWGPAFMALGLGGALATWFAFRLRPAAA